LSELNRAGIAVHEGIIRFCDFETTEKASVHAVQNGLVAGWEKKNSWSEVRISLREWLTKQGEVICVIKRIIASGTWFADNLESLHTLWADLYFILPDGSHGYYVNIDNERGTETNIW
jgi:hypothetical protein